MHILLSAGVTLDTIQTSRPTLQNAYTGRCLRVMLYNTSFIRKEFRNAYTQQSFSYRRQVSLGVFLGLLTFALYFSLQTMKESVINTAAPYLLLPSFFSTLYIYLFVSLFFNVWLYIANYEYMTLLEVRQNRWYALVQLWYSPTLLIASKIVARILAQLGIYTVGYIATLFLTSFLKFPLVTGYLFTMYLMGMLDVVLLAMLSLTISLFIKDMYNARYMVGIIALCVIAVQADQPVLHRPVGQDADERPGEYVRFHSDDLHGGGRCHHRGYASSCAWLRASIWPEPTTRPLLKTLPLLKQKPEGTVVVGAVTSHKRKSEQRILEAQTSPGGYETPLESARD